MKQYGNLLFPKIVFRDKIDGKDITEELEVTKSRYFHRMRMKYHAMMMDFVELSQKIDMTNEEKRFNAYGEIETNEIELIDTERGGNVFGVIGRDRKTGIVMEMTLDLI